MPTIASNTVSRTPLSTKQKQSGGAASPQRVRYRITWPDDLLERRQTEPLSNAFDLKRFVFNTRNAEVEDRAYQPTHHPNLDAAQTAADDDCGASLTWT